MIANNARADESPAEAELLHVGETYLRAALDALHEGVMLLDAAGRIVGANPAAGVLLGAAAGHVMGLARRDPRWRAVSEDGSPCPDEELPGSVALRTGRPRSGVVLGVHRPDAAMLWLLVSAVPLYDVGAARPHGAVVSFVDITARKRLEESLRADEARHRALIAGLPGGAVFVVGHDLRYRFAEGDALRAVGLRPADFAGKGLTELAPPGVAAEQEANYRGALAGEPFTVEHSVGDRAFLTRGVPLRGEGGAIDAVLAFSFDVTEHKRAEGALRASEARHRALHAAAARRARDLALLDRVRTALARELELAGVCRVVVEAVARTFGYTQVGLYLREGDEHVLWHQVGYACALARIPIGAGVSGRAVREGRALLIADAAADPAFLGAIDGVTAEICVPLDDAGDPVGFLNVESVGDARLDEGDLRLLEALGEQVGIALGRARRHEALRASEARLAHLALHDPLTGLPNRRGLAAALGSALARLGRGGSPVALLYLDLDGFKGVNDALGHEAGDCLLNAAADRLRASARAGDTPARLGGDEFAILLEGADAVDAGAVVARALAALRAPVRIGAATATISASAGVALAAAGESADTLLRRADAALYVAKRAGKDRVQFATD